MPTERIDGANVTDVIQAVDTKEVFDEIEPGAKEVSADAFLNAVINDREVTFETAQDILFGLIHTRKLDLTSGYTLRLP